MFMLLVLVYLLLFIGVPGGLAAFACRPGRAELRAEWTPSELIWWPERSARRAARSVAVGIVAAELLAVLWWLDGPVAGALLALVGAALLQRWLGRGRRQPRAVRVRAGEITIDRERRALGTLLDSRLEESGFGPWRRLSLTLLFPEGDLKIAADDHRPQDLEEVLAAVRAGAERPSTGCDDSPGPLAALLARAGRS